MTYEHLYNIYLNPFFKPRRVPWADALSAHFKGRKDLHVRGADWDHGTIFCSDVKLLDEVRVFLAPEYRVEKNTDGAILCDVVDFDF